MVCNYKGTKGVFLPLAHTCNKIYTLMLWAIYLHEDDTVTVGAH